MLPRLSRFLLLSHSDAAQRYWEIDMLRGVAIVSMVLYHLVFDLTMFGYYGGNFFDGPWQVAGRAIASLFIFLVGVSLSLSHARASRRASGWRLYQRYLARGLKLVGWGMVITVATWLFTGQFVVIFGILHLIGTSVMLAYPFLSRRWASLLVGAGVIALGVVAEHFKVRNTWLLPLGLGYPPVDQLDCFPLLPWFGVVLLGVFAGRLAYPGGVRGFALASLEELPAVRQLACLGRHSLLIYLGHQPVLMTVLILVTLIGVGR